ncbi:MAG: FAD-dependent oxidoreductase [Desulfotomaculum sp.]|nr:FAD-dependent oxidoreductase [Desulfotomaculum sp.]
MKIAIIGAGIAGMACALELEKLGIKPDIYEKSYKAGSLAPFSAAMMNLGLTQSDSQIKHLIKQYHLKINPLSEIKKIVIHTPTDKLSLSGSFGYLLKIGQDKESVHQQLYKKLNTGVKFKTDVNYFEIKNKYDWVVLADGSISIPIKLNIYQPTFQGWVRSAYLTGNFKPTVVKFWFDREYAREGFGCLTPFNEKSASLLLLVNGITRQELHDYWNTFVNKAGIKQASTGCFETEFQTGMLSSHVVDNTVIIGHSGGFVEAIWTQGIYFSLISGLEAARCIVKGEDYNQKIKPLIEANQKLYYLRQQLNKLDNAGLDLLIKIIKIPGIKHLAAAGDFSGIKFISNIVTIITGGEDKDNV